jgi:1,4-dihydroxy-2-naphthoate octaprenyltransferase
MKNWIKAARLRTLPLAIAGILLGSFQAMLQNSFHWLVLVLGLFTAVFLQILSNFANDYGDFIKGTDNAANRTDRALSAGNISQKQMKQAIIVTAFLALLCGVLLLYFGLQKISVTAVIYLAIGILSILSAIYYTIGKRAFGYMGFGDFFVFVFFGLVSVAGIFYLHTLQLNSPVLLAAIGCGLLSTAVLNVNNLRDEETDKKSNKKTIIVRLGYNFGLRYHNFLIWAGVLCILASFLLHIKLQNAHTTTLEYLMTVVVFSPMVFLFSAHTSAIKNADKTDRIVFNVQLKRLSLSILFLVLLYGVVCYFYTA